MPRLAYLAALFLPGVLSQAVSEAVCNVTSLSWTYNSMNQSPCDVTADLAGVCNGGVFTLQPLGPGFVYLGPSKIVANSCRCSTVYYSMLSACAACQGNSWLDWTQYNGNCTSVFLGSFPQALPSGLKVPAWAYANISSTNSFNLLRAQSLGDQPESTGLASPTNTLGSPTLADPFTASLDLTTFLPTFSSISSPNSNSSNSNAGAIAGGVIGGVVGLALIAGLVFFFLRRRGGESQGPASSAFNTTSYVPAPYSPAPAPDMSYNPNASSQLTPSQTQPQRFYDTSNQNAFPTAPAGVPNSPYSGTNHSPPPAPTGYNAFQGSTPQIAQPQMPTPTPATGHYTGAPEL